MISSVAFLVFSFFRFFFILFVVSLEKVASPLCF